MEIRWNYNTLDSVVLKPYVRKKNIYYPDRMRNRGRFKKWLGFLSFVSLFIYFFIYIIVSSSEQANSDINIGAVIGWTYNTSRETSQYITLNTSYVPKTFCESPSLLLVIVFSAPSNKKARVAIRDTWGLQRNFSGSVVSLYFLLGATNNVSLQQDIVEENDKYNDIVQESFIDSYNNLTLKSVMMLKLVSNYCANSIKFLFKTDDDMYVNMPQMIKLLHQKKDSKDVLLGHLICNAKPIMDYTNKWYAPKYMYPEKVYPNYLSGTGYLMSIDLIPKLYKAALQTPIFHLEDIYITGICSKVINVKPHSHPGMTYETLKHDPCVFKDIISLHHQTPEDLKTLHKIFKVTNFVKACRIQQENLKNNFSVNQWILNHLVNRKPTKRLCY